MIVFIFLSQAQNKKIWVFLTAKWIFTGFTVLGTFCGTENHFWQTNRLWTGIILKLTTVASLQAKKRGPKGTLSVFIGHHKPKIMKNGGNKLIATFPFFAKQRSVNQPYLSIQATQKDGSKHSEILRERALQLFSLEFSKNTLNIFISYLLNGKTSIENLKFNPFAVRNLHF